MKILAHTPLILSREGFPRIEDGEPHMPGYLLTESIASSVITSRKILKSRKGSVSISSGITYSLKR